MATPIATIDTQHADMVHDAQLDYYGRKLATCSSDRLIKVYDVSRDETTQTAELAGHEGPVWQVAWAHPQFGVLLASAGYDRRALVHREVSPGNWTRILSFEEHASSVNSVAWGPAEYGLTLATASSDGRVAIVTHRDDDSWASTMLSDAPTGVNAVTWAPAHHVGGTVAAGEGSRSVQRIATAGCDNAVRVYAGVDGEGWVQEAVLASRHRDWVRDVAWAPATGLAVNVIASCSDDGTVVIWRQTTPRGEWAAEALPPFPAPVWRVSWSVTGSLLAVSCGDNSVTLWKESLGGAWAQISTVPDASQAAPQQMGRPAAY